MEGNGFTGFNPSVLKVQIKDFYEMGMRIRDNLYHARNNFYDILYHSWWSPKAVAFASHFYDLDRAIYNLGVAYSNVAHNMVEAYNGHARNNNLSPLSNDYESLPYQEEGQKFGEINMLAQSEEGNVGMDTSKVEMAKEGLREAINKALGDIFASYQMPAFYDESGSQVISFVKTLDWKREELNGIFTSVINDIELKINEEIDLSKSAVSSAKSVLSNDSIKL